jgi:hypothetical protein
MADLVDRLWTLVRHGRDQGMKMDDVEDAVREIERLRGQVKLSDNLLGGLTNLVEGLKAELALATSSLTSKEAK